MVRGSSSNGKRKREGETDMKLIDKWWEKKLTCFFCGHMKNVKYVTKYTVDGIDTKDVFVCNECAKMYSLNLDDWGTEQ